MDPDFPDLGASPVLRRSIKKLEFVDVRNKNKLTLEEVHKRLLQHLKKGQLIPRDELKEYLEQTTKMNTGHHKNHWLLVKIKGILNYILKKRSDIQCSNVEGQFTIYERCASDQIANVGSIHEPQEFKSQPNSQSFNFPSNLLTNDNFVTALSNHKPIQMEVENSYNYSQDLFSDTVTSLHTLSQENYHLLKELTNNEETSSSENSFVFKVPNSERVEKVFKMYDKVEEDYNNSLFGLTQSVSGQDSATCDINMASSQNTQSQKFSFNSFDDLTITNEELRLEFDDLLAYTENWVSDITNNLINLQVCDINHISTEDAGNISTSSDNQEGACNISIATQDSEENLKILREVCCEFKKNLAEEMKSNPNLDLLKELLSSSDLSSLD